MSTALVTVITESLLGRVRDHNLEWLSSKMIDKPLSFGVSQEEGVL